MSNEEIMEALADDQMKHGERPDDQRTDKSMKNKFEGFCYVCGEVVPEGEGVAEQQPRKSGEAGFGSTKWVVRHTSCKGGVPAQDNKQNK